MGHLLRAGSWEYHLSNEGWRQLCTLAWQHGWRPEVGPPWPDDECGALHWAMEYERKELTLEETSSFVRALKCAIAARKPLATLGVEGEASLNLLTHALLAEFIDKLAGQPLSIIA
jgi:hypothetical protein